MDDGIIFPDRAFGKPKNTCIKWENVLRLKEFVCEN